VHLATRRVGSGPSLVCHPGGPGFSSWEFGDDLGGLDSSRELVFVDPRGTGDTGPGNTDRLADYVADLDELRADLDLDAIDLLGFSHGGIVALAYAAAHPARVRKLVAASTIAAVTDETAAEMEALKAAKADEAWFAAAVDALDREERGEYEERDFGQLWLDMAPLYFARWDERYRPWLDVSTRGSAPDPLRTFNSEPFDLRPDLPKIEADTLVITGAADFICGPAAAEAIAAGVRGAEVVILPDAGHMTYVEQPAAFRAAVEGFLAR
jgi:pimeloyl-ACP methyl ester carboxylesterase